MQQIKRLSLPLILDCVLELGHDLTGGKEWDVRSISPRGPLQSKDCTSKSHGDGLTTIEKTGNQHQAMEVISSNKPRKTPPEDSELLMVCRPKVGVTGIGGGFVGMWKKMNEKF